MNSLRPFENAWNKVAQLAAAAPADAADAPFGFASRVVAAWQANRRETTLAAFEWLTLRGLAVALLIFAGSAAFGYETVSEVFTGETSVVSGWVDMLSLPL
jgi:hypothetical protein